MSRTSGMAGARLARPYVHAHVDESIVQGRYTIAAVLVPESQLQSLDRELRGLLLPGQTHLHFVKEKRSRRLAVLRVLQEHDVSVLEAQRPLSGGDARTRSECLRELGLALVEHGRVRRIVVESRPGRDHHDRRDLSPILRPHVIGFNHLAKRAEARLWAADPAAWCCSHGGTWRDRLLGIP